MGVIFNDLKSLYGFPKDTLVGRLINELFYSDDWHWLRTESMRFNVASLERKSGLPQPGI